MAQPKLPLPLSFEEIMQRHQREIMRYLLRLSSNPEDAEDLYQETWLRAYRAYPRLEPADSVRPWLYTIASNLWRNRARDSARYSRVLVPDEKELPAADLIAKDHRLDHENEGYAAVHLRELLAALPAKQQQALQLRYFAGFSYAEIAKAIDCSEESARGNVSQAMGKVKKRW
jgi:RNA polymerase sigma-70 factor (ECF subfamily)